MTVTPPTMPGALMKGAKQDHHQLARILADLCRPGTSTCTIIKRNIFIKHSILIPHRMTPYSFGFHTQMPVHT